MPKNAKARSYCLLTFEIAASSCPCRTRQMHMAGKADKCNSFQAKKIGGKRFSISVAFLDQAKFFNLAIQLPVAPLDLT